MGDGSCAFQIIRSRVHTTCTRDVCITLGHVTDKDECGVHTMSPLEDFPAEPHEFVGIALARYDRVIVSVFWKLRASRTHRVWKLDSRDTRIELILFLFSVTFDVGEATLRQTRI